MGNGARKCEWRHAPEARGGFGWFWKSQLIWVLPREKTFGFRLLAETGPVALWQVPHVLAGGGADGKVIIERLCISLPYVETFNSTVIKSFVHERRTLRVFVFRDSYVLCMYVICYIYMHIYIYIYIYIYICLWTFYQHSMNVSHIHVWVCYIIIVIIFTLWKFFISALADTSLAFFTRALAGGLSLESEWQQIDSDLQDHFQYSSRSEQCFKLHGLHPSISDSFSTFSKLSETVPSVPITISITVTFMFRIFLCFSGKVQVLVSFSFFRFVWSSLCSLVGRQSPL